MDDLHERCQRLESIVRSLDPSLDIEELLREGHATVTSVVNHEPSSLQTYSSGSSREASGLNSPEPETEPAEEEADPFQADGFECKECVERVVSIADGMASLNIDSRDVGYLGLSISLYHEHNGMNS